MTSGRIPKRARVVRAKRDFSHGWGARGFQAMLRSGRGSQRLRWGWKGLETPSLYFRSAFVCINLAPFLWIGRQPCWQSSKSQRSYEIKEEDVLGVVECEDELQILPNIVSSVSSRTLWREGKSAPPLPALHPTFTPQGFLSTLVPSWALAAN